MSEFIDMGTLFQNMKFYILGKLPMDGDNLLSFLAVL